MLSVIQRTPKIPLRLHKPWRDGGSIGESIHTSSGYLIGSQGVKPVGEWQISHVDRGRCVHLSLCLPSPTPQLKVYSRQHPIISILTNSPCTQLRDDTGQKKISPLTSQLVTSMTAPALRQTVLPDVNPSDLLSIRLGHTQGSSPVRRPDSHISFSCISGHFI